VPSLNTFIIPRHTIAKQAKSGNPLTIKMISKIIKRKIITNILSYTKERLRLINLVVCNSVSLNTAEKFFRMAAKILPAADFQHILGKCITEQEIEQDKLGFIKEFMKDISIGNR